MLAGTDLKPISPDELKKLEIAVADTTGKKPDESGYGLWPKAGGIEVPELSGEKVASKVYLIRTAPTSDTPAGKPQKLKVKGQQKAPKLKIDYKKEVLKGKENICVSAGGEMLAQNLTKEAAKAGVDISESLTEGSRTSIKVWIGASAKKAATAVQTIEAAARAAAPVSGTALTVTDGKFKLDKKYEVYNEAKQKWGGLPKITSSCILKLRVKADAKGGKESDSTYAASAPVNLVITFGLVDEDKNKQGVISAVIEEIEDTD